MKNIMIILKGILFVFTFGYTMLFLCSIDVLADNNKILEGVLTVAGLMLFCYLFITKEDIEKLFHIPKDKD